MKKRIYEKNLLKLYLNKKKILNLIKATPRNPIFPIQYENKPIPRLICAHLIKKLHK